MARAGRAGGRRGPGGGADGGGERREGPRATAEPGGGARCLMERRGEAILASRMRSGDAGRSAQRVWPRRGWDGLGSPALRGQEPLPRLVEARILV